MIVFGKKFLNAVHAAGKLIYEIIFSLVLITENQKHFKRIEGLEIWPK
jgi:hypothetical protein